MADGDAVPEGADSAAAAAPLPEAAPAAAAEVPFDAYWRLRMEEATSTECDP